MPENPETLERKLGARRRNARGCLAGPSPYEGAANIAPAHPNAPLMRRMQDSNFREAWRVTAVVLKIERDELQMQALEKTTALHYVLETKWVSVYSQNV